MRIVNNIRAVLYSLFILCHSIQLQAKQEAVVQEINRVAYPLDTSIHLQKEFLPDSVFTNRSIIALGESTHGTHEFFTTKDYIIRNQVLNNKVKAIAIEADLCRILKLNQYLIDNSRSLNLLRTLFYNTGMYQIYNTEELYSLLSWVKKYNLSKKNDNEKVKFFGLDMQTPYVIIQSMIDSFPLLKKLSEREYNKLLELRDHSISPNAGKLSKSEITAYKELADQISILARKNASSKSIPYILEFAELMKQSLALSEGFLGGGYAAKRDEFMARNAAWIKGNFTTDTEKMIIWAHNDHIAHAKIGGSYRMGYYLKEQFKEQFYALSFVFDEGYIRASDPSGNEFKSFFYPSSTYNGSIEAVLKNAHAAFYFLNVSGIKNRTIIDFFERNTYQKNVGQAYNSNLNRTFLKLPVLECFDGLIFIRKTHAAETLNLN